MSRTMMTPHAMMSHTTFASCANAAHFCAMIAVVDAIFMASIIIFAAGCGLICLSILGISLVLAVLVVCGKVHSHWAWRLL